MNWDNVLVHLIVIIQIFNGGAAIDNTYMVCPDKFRDGTENLLTCTATRVQDNIDTYCANTPEILAFILTRANTQVQTTLCQIDLPVQDSDCGTAPTQGGCSCTSISETEYNVTFKYNGDIRQDRGGNLKCSICGLLDAIDIVSDSCRNMVFECPPGRYGDKCQHCGNCSLYDVCDKQTGICPNGCQDGFKGSTLCTETCDRGTYGKKCESQCGQCLHDAPCSIWDGRCDTGCKPEYQASAPLCNVKDKVDEDPNSGAGLHLGFAAGLLCCAFQLFMRCSGL